MRCARSLPVPQYGRAIVRPPRWLPVLPVTLTWLIPKAVAELLGVLRQGGAGDALDALLARDPARRTDLYYQPDPFLRDGSAGLADLLRALNDAGAHGAAAALAIRCYDAGMFHLSHLDFAPQYPCGREPDGTPSHPWQWHDPPG